METERDKHVFLHQNSSECIRNKNKQVEGEHLLYSVWLRGNCAAVDRRRGGEEEGMLGGRQREREIKKDYFEL